MSFSLIACIGKNRELGKNNDLIFHIKRDMQFFREKTLNHTIVMGRNTLESLKNKPLPKRKNLVLTSKAEKLPEGLEKIPDLTTFIEENKTTDEEIFIIGGASVYKTFLPYAKNLYLTKVAKTANADVYFPDFDEEKYDKIVLEEGVENDLTFEIIEYKLKN